MHKARRYSICPSSMSKTSTGNADASASIASLTISFGR